MRRGPQGGNQDIALAVSLEATELGSRDHHDLVTPVHGHVPRPFAVHASHPLAEARNNHCRLGRRPPAGPDFRDARAGFLGILVMLTRLSSAVPDASSALTSSA